MGMSSEPMRSDRASLYSTFGSKDELIRAYLENRMEISKARLRAAAEAHADPRERLLSVFGVQAAVFARRLSLPVPARLSPSRRWRR